MIDLPAKYADLTWSERRSVREEYIKKQGGLCQHCDEPLSGAAHNRIRSKPVNVRLFPPAFFRHPVHLHHDHKSGMTIGAVHNYCNAVLWQYHGE